MIDLLHTIEFLGTLAGLLYMLRVLLLFLATTVMRARHAVREAVPFLSQFRSVTLASVSGALVASLGLLALVAVVHPVGKFVGAFLLTFGIQLFLWSIGITSAFLGNDVPSPNDYRDGNHPREVLPSRSQRRLTSR